MKNIKFTCRFSIEALQYKAAHFTRKVNIAEEFNYITGKTSVT